jgi:hypothetical protein
MKISEIDKILILQPVFRAWVKTAGKIPPFIDKRTEIYRNRIDINPLSDGRFVISCPYLTTGLSGFVQPVVSNDYNTRSGKIQAKLLYIIVDVLVI